VRAIVLSPKPYAGDPLINKTSILSRAQVIGMIDAAGKDIVTQGTATTLQPGEQAGSGVRKKFELHRPARLGLCNGRARADLAATDDVADLEAYDIASSEFAVDCHIKERAVAKPPVVIEVEADAPYLLRL
jgi:hypothetical protein